MLEPRIPCAACKMQRRRCTQDCIFAPYFPADRTEKFEKVHQVFGASNIAKILTDLHVSQRAEAVQSLVFEAEARIYNPAYGCVGSIYLQQQCLKQIAHEIEQTKKELAFYEGLAALQSNTLPPLDSHHRGRVPLQQQGNNNSYNPSVFSMPPQSMFGVYDQQQQQQQKQKDQLMRYGGGQISRGRLTQLPPYDNLPYHVTQVPQEDQGRGYHHNSYSPSVFSMPPQSMMVRPGRGQGYGGPLIIREPQQQQRQRLGSQLGMDIGVRQEPNLFGIYDLQQPSYDNLRCYVTQVVQQDQGRGDHHNMQEQHQNLLEEYQLNEEKKELFPPEEGRDHHHNNKQKQDQNRQVVQYQLQELQNQGQQTILRPQQWKPKQNDRHQQQQRQHQNRHLCVQPQQLKLPEQDQQHQQQQQHQPLPQQHQQQEIPEDPNDRSAAS